MHLIDLDVVKLLWFVTRQLRTWETNFIPEMVDNDMEGFSANPVSECMEVVSILHRFFRIHETGGGIASILKTRDVTCQTTSYVHTY